MPSDALDDAGPPGAHDDLVRLRYYLPSTHPGVRHFSPLKGPISDLTLGGHEGGRHADQAGSTASYDLVSDPNTQKWLPVPPYSCSRPKM